MSTSNDPFASVFAGSPSYEVDPVQTAFPSTGPSHDEPAVPPQQTAPQTQPVAHDVESLRSISYEVEQFTRQWFTRIRRVINRSAQLLERESLLAGAIAKLDQQKSEWSRRTAERELALRDQAKQLTAAWMEVEAERRKSLQGGRMAAPMGAMPMGTAGPVVRTASPPVSVSPPSPTTITGPTTITNATSPGTTAEATPSVHLTDRDAEQTIAPSDRSSTTVGHTAHQSHQPPPISSPTGAGNAASRSGVPPVANRPILPTSNSSIDDEGLSEQERCEADAQSRQRIEEFKRMQRALRFNRQR
ncbi:hypothetical protein U8335_14505 [Roseiconus lacunae]|uniref:hypothetical protein n=1 Tax=Roseiconus lacunae TaxID=2605694 RepID=UPI00308E2FEE|nr:hypothetical protein U8335_14505 [Stieleria sp. HD01]